MDRLRWASSRRRVIFDSHELRVGVFYLKTKSHMSIWLHLPFTVIDLGWERKHELQ